MIKITEVNVKIPKTDLGNIKAFVGITLEDSFAIHDIKVISGEEGLFVAMPSKKVADGYRDVCHPINKEVREMVNAAVLEAYEKEVTAKAVEQAE